MGHVACMGEIRNVYKNFIGKAKGEMPRGRTRHRWEDIKMDLRNIMLEGVDWINFVQDRNQWQVLVNTVMQIFVA
jgi:hypothetical protein